VEIPKDLFDLTVLCLLVCFILGFNHVKTLILFIKYIPNVV
jgi:hypothetical protein